MGNVFERELDSYKLHSIQVLTKVGSKDLLGILVLEVLAEDMVLGMASVGT